MCVHCSQVDNGDHAVKRFLYFIEFENSLTVAQFQLNIWNIGASYVSFFSFYILSYISFFSSYISPYIAFYIHSFRYLIIVVRLETGKWWRVDFFWRLILEKQHVYY